MAYAEAVYRSTMETAPPSVEVPGDDAPVPKINGEALRLLGTKMVGTFSQYASDRKIQEDRWMRNLYQYLGYYDDDVRGQFVPNRSQAYPKVTRIKCVSMLARLMNLLFPSDDRNWTLDARPHPDMEIIQVKAAILAQQKLDQLAGNQVELTEDYVTNAVMKLAKKNADKTRDLIDDQLKELGGDQSYDYVQLINEIIASGILYGIGVLRGPFVREVKVATWKWDAATNSPVAVKRTRYMPQFLVVNVWDYYPDLSARRVENSSGYFLRHVMSRKEVRDLADKEDYFGDQIKTYLEMYQDGNYVAKPFETQLRSVGTRSIVNEQKPKSSKFELISWHGPISAHTLTELGIIVPDGNLSSMLDAEIWLIDNTVIKCVINPWVELGVDLKDIHLFVFDRDDTAPIGFGLPNVMRDTQMSISAGTRMMLDNASVCCGPILELNTGLLRDDNDNSAITAYKIFNREDEGPSAQFPAVRQIKIDAHIDELQKMIEMFLKFADMETFVGPATGGDMEKMPSEPMRNAAGASMLMGNAALPFKQIIRNFDATTMSIIYSMVQFNRHFNPDDTPVAAYSVIARGASSLVAKELRGAMIDQLVATLKPEEMDHLDMRGLLEARLAARDMDKLLIPMDEAMRKIASRDQVAQMMQQLQQAGIEATNRNLLAQAFKNIAQGQKNQGAAQADAVSTMLSILEHGAEMALTKAKTVDTHAAAINKVAPNDPTNNQGSADGGPEDGEGAGGDVPSVPPRNLQPGDLGTPGLAPSGIPAGIGGLIPGNIPGGAGPGQGLQNAA